MDLLNAIFPIIPTCAILILVLAIGSGVNFFWLKFMLGRIRACPECGRKGAGTIVDTQEIVLSNNVDYRRRKPTRIKEIKVVDHFQCDFCNHTWTRDFKRKEFVQMDT